MKITEQAVHAALDKWRDHEFDGTLDNPRMRKALTSAYPHLHPVDVAAVRRQAFEECADTVKYVVEQIADYMSRRSLAICEAIELRDFEAATVLTAGLQDEVRRFKRIDAIRALSAEPTQED